MWCPTSVIVIISACLVASVVQSQIVDTFAWNNGDQASRESEECISTSTDNNSRETYQGYTCKYRANCGHAPLNHLSQHRSSVDPFIVNGEDQIYGEWPSFARLVIVFENSSRPMACGGVLISDMHVLTAAHCIYSNENVGASSVVAILGGHNTTRKSRYEQKIEVKETCMSDVYEFYKKEYRVYRDWAVLTLEYKVQLNDYIQPACLPYESNDASQYKYCHHVGWGANSLEKDKDGIYPGPPVIQKMPVRQVACTKDDYEQETIACYVHAKMGTDSFAGGTYFGDSGGPILCLDEITRRWTVTATLSAGASSKWLDLFVKTTTVLSDIKTTCKI